LEYLERPGVGDLGAVALGMLGASNRPLAVAYCTLVAVGLVVLWRHGTSGKQQAETWRWRRALVTGWLLLPPALLFVASQIQPMFMYRLLLTSAPAIAVTAALGLVALARRSQALAAAAAAIVICLAVLARIGLDGRTEVESRSARQGEAAALLIASQSRASDGIAYAPAIARYNVEWELENEAAPDADLPVDFAVAAEPEEIDQIDPREVSPAILVSRLRRYRRVWLVQDSGTGLGWHPTPEPMLVAGLSALRSEYRLVRSHQFGDLKVELYERSTVGGKR
jgi:hypothetical protein